MKLNKLLVGLSAVLLSSTLSIGLACTSLAIEDADKNIYHGRTLELTANLPSWMSFYPKDTFFQKIKQVVTAITVYVRPVGTRKKVEDFFH